MRGLFFGALALGACAPEAGSLHLVFVSEDGPIVLSQAGSIRGAVEDRSEAQPGPVIAGGAPVPLAPGLFTGAHLPSLEVPYGADRVAVVELLEGSRLIRYGVSEPFTLTAADRGMVLEVPLRPPPQILRIDLEGEIPGLSRTATITLRVSAERAVQLELSNDLAAEPEVLPSSGQADQLFWDLDRGQIGPCPAGRNCSRQLYLRAVDAQGYKSVVQTATVVVDRLPPSVLEAQAILSIVPPAPSPIVVAHRGAPGARVIAAFTLLEAQGRLPRLWAGATPFEPCTLEGPIVRCALTVPELGPSDRDLPLLAQLRDQAGNRATVALGLLPYDGAAPSAPDTSERSRAELRRFPQGRFGDDTPSITIEGGPGAIEPGALAIAVDGPEGTTARALGRSEAAGPDGAFGTLRLPSSDRDQVWLVAVDAAGRQSVPAPVLYGTWHGRVGPGRPGRAFLTADALPIREAPFERQGRAEDATRLLAEDDGQVLRLAPAVLWQRRDRVLSPGPWRRMGVATDRARGEVLAFGGKDAAQLLDRLWIWNGQSWRSPTLAGDRPSARSLPAMGFDAHRREVLLFGGDAAGVLDDTWLWRDDHWIRMETGVHPPARTEASLFYDPSQRSLILVGGFDGAGPLADQWRWDGQGWAQLPGPGPGARQGAAVAWDPGSERAFLYGGLDPTGGSLDDLWSWSGGQWSRLSTTGTTTPGRRYQAQLVYDPSRAELVLIGGVGPDLAPAPVAYGLDPGTLKWRPIPLPVEVAARVGQGAAFDPLREGLLLFGGATISEPATADVWSSRVDALLELTPSPGPSARQGAAMTFDPLSGSVLLYGGLDGLAQARGDTWRWGGERWRPVLGPSPNPPLLAPQATFDAVRGAVVLCGRPGSLEETRCFRFDGAGWLPVSTATTLGPRLGAAMVPSPLDGRPLLIGGQSTAGQASDQVARLGEDWDLVFDPLPAAATGLSVDALAGQLYALAGTDSAGRPLPDGWRWANGAGWQPLGLTGPASRSRATLQALPNGALALFGGIDGSARPLEDTWLLGGSPLAWQAAQVLGDSPPARMLHSGARGPEGAFVFGGCLADTCSARASDLWSLRPGQRPTMTVLLAGLAQGAPDQWVAEELRVILSGANRPSPELWDSPRAQWVSVALDGEGRLPAGRAASFLDGRGEAALRWVGEGEVPDGVALEVRYRRERN